MFCCQLMKIRNPPIFLLSNEQNPIRRPPNCLRMPPTFICIRRYYEWKPCQNLMRNADFIANSGKCLVKIKYPAIFSIGSLPTASFQFHFSGSNSTKCKQTLPTHWDSSCYRVCDRLVFLSMRVMLYIFFIMHNITSVFLLCKLFLLLFLCFPFLVLGYLGHLQPMGHLPVGTNWTASTQPLRVHSHKCSHSIRAVAKALK